MKGILLSFLFFCILVMTIASILHINRPSRAGKTFWIVFWMLSPFYFLAHVLTPSDLWFLPKTLLSNSAFIDMFFGFFVFALNFHSFLDFFFAVNGGFSTCLTMEISRNRGKSATPAELLEKFHQNGDQAGIQNYRIINLLKGGYILLNNTTSCFELTAKGKVARKITAFADIIFGTGGK